MKVLHINTYFSKSPFYKQLYDKQIENELDISVFVSIPIGTSRSKENQDMGGYTTIKKNFRKYDRLFFHIKNNKIYQDIKNTYDINKFDLLHAHSLFTNGYIAYKLKQEYGIPYVVAVRNSDVNVFFAKMIHLRRLGVKILNNADRVVFISEPYKKRVLNDYIPQSIRNGIEGKSVVIKNGIDKFWLQNMNSKSKKLSTNELNILYVGRIDKNKNLLTTMKAVSKMSNTYNNITYSVVGEIQDKKIYNELCKNKEFNYLGVMDKKKLIEVYKEADIFVMPSIKETFGLVYVEAMSQGVPVIYTKDQGFDGQFNEGVVGYSVECTSSKDIQDKIKMIIDNYPKISTNCIELVKYYGWNNIEEIYRSLYKKILETVNNNSLERD